MSDATFSGPVVVTGASGYVASWVVHELLSRGATVHGTVRDPNHPTKTAHLRALDDELPGTLKLFAADLLKPGSFAEALDGATTVIHTASPFHSGDGDPQATLVQPALDGTANVLDQASQTPTVTRVVLTSSVLAVYGDATESDGRPLTEDDWNSSSSVDHQPYAYSKTVAERKAWELAEAQSQWRLVVVNPAFVMGPSLSGRKDSTSMDFLLNNLKGTWKSGTLPMSSGFVDVRDVATAHVEAAVRPDAEGRHILSAEVVSFHAFGQIIEAAYPGRFGVPRREVPKLLATLAAPFIGFTRRYVRDNAGHALAFDASKSRESLGLVYRPLAETVHDMVERALADGLVE